MRRRKFISSLNIGIASTVFLTSKTLGRPFTSYPETDPFGEEELSYHTIQSVKFDEVRMQYPRLVGKNARLDLHGYGPRLGISIITTDKGAIGWGELRGGRREAEKLSGQLVGKKVSEVFNSQTGILNNDSLPFDTALHDLAGIVLDKPVYELLGRETPVINDCYSGMIYFDDLEPAHKPGGIDKILEECQFDYELGYRQFKLKIGRGNRWMPLKEGLKRDIEVTQKAAEAFPDCDILVDGNNGFSVQEFIQYMEGIQGIPLFWIEEPFHETVHDYEKLRAWLISNDVDTLLADGEADPEPNLLMELMKRKLMDVYLTDIQGYGFTNWRRLMPELIKLEVQASPHTWGSLLKTHYTAHLAGGLGNTVTIEGVTSTSDDVDLSGYRLEKGKLIPPDNPGFGMPLLKKT